MSLWRLGARIMKQFFFLGLLIALSFVQSRGQDKLDGAFQMLRDAVEQGEIPGSIALVARAGHVLRHEACGLRNIESQLPFTTNTLCWIASITKPVTAAAAMTLVDQGRLVSRTR